MKKKNEGGPLEDFENFRKKTKIENFEQCHSAEKCKKGESLGFFTIHSLANFQKK